MAIIREDIYSGRCDTCQRLFTMGGKYNFKDSWDIVKEARLKRWEATVIDDGSVELKCPKCIKEGK